MLRRFFSYYAPYKKLFFLDFGCAILAGLLELGFPMAIKTFIDKLLPAHDWVLIIGATVGLLLIYLFNTALMAIVNYWGHALGVGIETDMRREAFSHLQKLSFRYYDNTKTGHIITHVTKDLEEVGEIAHHGPEDVLLGLEVEIERALRDAGPLRDVLQLGGCEPLLREDRQRRLHDLGRPVGLAPAEFRFAGVHRLACR